MVRSGKLGMVRYFDSQFSMQVKEDNIRVKRKLGGGPLYDIGIYCINAMRMNFAAEPERVWATSVTSSDPRFREVEETVVAVLEFPDNRIGTFTCSFGAADRGAYEVVGSKGSIRLDPAYEHAEGLSYEVALGEKKRRKHFGKSDQFAPELLYFSDCILKGKEPEPSGEEGLMDVEIIEALQESMASGQWEEVRVSRNRRPKKAQIIRRPPLRKPRLVHAESPHT
jgi:glucose-fructose oxidoreductase